MSCPFLCSSTHTRKGLQLTRCRSETNFGDFESIWNGIQQETNATRDMLAEEEAYKHYGDEADAWKNFDGAQGFDNMRLHDQFAGELGHYLFEENNLFKDVPNAFEEGMKIVREGGNLSLAALAFEAAVQRDENFVEAWAHYKIHNPSINDVRATPRINIVSEGS